VQNVDIETALDWRGRTVVDRDGEKIGTLKEIYLDESERPAWASIHTGLFGLRQSMAPLSEAQLDGDEVRLPYARDQVTDAPNVDPDVQLTAEEEDRLHRHYGPGSAASEEAPEPGEDAPAPAEEATEPGAVAASGGDDEEATDDAMTRSEEEVRIGKRVRERGRVRLKKYVVTDYVEKKVPVQREEVRLEREPPEETDDERV
jgi:sporulation protein YlmC with PRC-barrel domain